MSVELREAVMERAFVVDTKDNKRVPYVHNKVQRYIKSQAGHWVVEVKPRQVGSTTFWMLEFFMDILIYAPMYMAVVSHEDEATARLLNKIKTTYNNLPDDFRPRIHHDSTHEMSFPEIGSAIYIGTAGSRAFGRGDMFGRVVLSETAHWASDQARNIRVAIQESAKAGRVVIESTPYGEGNEFHTVYLGAKEGRMPYTPLFIPWFLNDEYAYSPDHPLVRNPRDREGLEVTGEEMGLIALYQLTLDQIRWRRVTMGGMSPDEKEARSLFLQEYPEDDISCFASIGEGAFTQSGLEMLTPREPMSIEEEVMFWYKPLPGRALIISADCATGFAEDSSVGLVLDITDYPRVIHIATVEGKFRDDEFANILARLGNKLGCPCIAVEANDVGQSVLNSLINYLHYPYVYHQSDPISGIPKIRPGYVVSAPSKRMLVTEGKRVIDSGYLVSHDKNLIKQLRFFRRNGDGSYRGAPGVHDDSVMALLIGLVAGGGTAPLTERKSHSYGWGW